MNHAFGKTLFPPHSPKAPAGAWAASRRWRAPRSPAPSCQSSRCLSIWLPLSYALQCGCFERRHWARCHRQGDGITQTMGTVAACTVHRVGSSVGVGNIWRKPAGRKRSPPLCSEKYVRVRTRACATPGGLHQRADPAQDKTAREARHLWAYKNRPAAAPRLEEQVGEGVLVQVRLAWAKNTSQR